MFSRLARFREMRGRISTAKLGWLNDAMSLVLYDMLRNANRASLEDIVHRQKILSHGYDVLQPDEPGNWKAPYAADRAAFIRAFNDYAHANPNGRPQLWSEWLKASTQ